MKLFRSTPIFIKGILIAGMLSACQNENDTVMAPETPTSTPDENARTAVAVGALIKDGNVDLAYYNQSQNLLWKETNSGTETEFTYAPQLITAKRYINGSPMEYKYTLDGSGRCIQTFHSASNKTYIYEYNFNGQLTRWYNKDQENEQAVFTYAVNSDSDATKSMSKVSFYNTQGALTKVLRFSYGSAGAIADKYPLNPDVLPAGVSKYLRVFGNFNTNLVSALTEENYSANGQMASLTKYQFTYTFDYAGKAKNITVRKFNGPVVSSTDRKYFVPTYSF